jgi:hypothetical protein
MEKFKKSNDYTNLFSTKEDYSMKAAVQNARRTMKIQPFLSKMWIIPVKLHLPGQEGEGLRRKEENIFLDPDFISHHCHSPRRDWLLDPSGGNNGQFRNLSPAQGERQG